MSFYGKNYDKKYPAKPKVKKEKPVKAKSNAVIPDGLVKASGK